MCSNNAPPKSGKEVTLASLPPLRTVRVSPHTAQAFETLFNRTRRLQPPTATYKVDFHPVSWYEAA